MLALQFIRENKDSLLLGLQKRGFKNPEVIDQIIELDQKRRSQQAKLDSLLAESNQMAKEIGALLSQGSSIKPTCLKKKVRLQK